MCGAGRGGAEELGRDVGWDQPPGEVPGEGEGYGHGRVYVGAGDVPHGVDGGHYRQTEGETYPQRATPLPETSFMITAPVPAKTSRNVPENSAARRLIDKASRRRKLPDSLMPGFGGGPQGYSGFDDEKADQLP